MAILELKPYMYIFNISVVFQFLIYASAVIEAVSNPHFLLYIHRLWATPLLGVKTLQFCSATKNILLRGTLVPCNLRESQWSETTYSTGTPLIRRFLLGRISN